MLTKANVIFLDFDGVIISPRAQVFAGKRDYGRGSYNFDPVAIEGINTLCRTKNAHVVISSTHREAPGVNYILRGAGFTGRFFDVCDFMDTKSDEWKKCVSDPRRRDHTQSLVIDGTITPLSDGIGGFRGDQINAWWKSFGRHVANWVILDDHQDFHPAQKYHLALCDGENGMPFGAFTRAEDILDGILG